LTVALCGCVTWVFTRREKYDGVMKMFGITGGSRLFHGANDLHNLHL